jgi:hypothetical protein
MRTAHDNPAIPLVVQLGFAGSRNLSDAAIHLDAVRSARFEEDVCQLLIELIAHLRSELKLSSQHFFCGVSQIAIGGDTVFTRACQHLKIPQRIFLPQHLDEYLVASGRQGPDFSPTQQQTARELLTDPHIIQEWVVSDVSARQERFSDTNWEIVRVSDVIVCLIREDQASKPGGTLELIEMANKRGKPVLLVTLRLENGIPIFKSDWFNREKFQPPTLPEELLKIPPLPATGSESEAQKRHDLPTAKDYANHLKAYASLLAQSHKGLFKTAALIILTTHFLATLCAVIAVQFRYQLAHGLAWFLVAELLLLGLGFAIHHRLHRREASRLWATSRLVAELARSAIAIGKQYLYLGYFFQLPFPENLRSLLRTLNVLHLASTARAAPADTWQIHRDTYLQQRLEGTTGQIAFYARESARAAKLLHKAHAAFNVFSLGAFAAALCKLTHVGGPLVNLVLGPLAILLPVLAVAALSLAAAFDWAARQSTFVEILVFLRAQHQLLQRATTEREYGRLVLETESRLLGETVNWYSRRAFTGVA